MTDVETASAPDGSLRLSEFNLTRKYEAEEGHIYLTGVQALVRVAIEQSRLDRASGLNVGFFVSGYPGSPLGGLDLELEKRADILQRHNVVHQPGLNEELAATAVMGSQTAGRLGELTVDGVVGIWYGKAPGLDRSADAIRLGNYYGTTRHGGVLLCVGDDPTSKSSTTPSSSDALLSDLAVPVLYPGTVQEVLDLGLHGIAMSRACGLWTAIKVVTGVADGAGTATVSPDRIRPIIPPGPDGRPLGRLEPASLSPPKILTVEQDLFEVRLPAALEYARANGLNEIIGGSSDDWLGIVAPGSTYYETLSALKRLGIELSDLSSFGIRLLHVRVVNPVDTALVREFGRGLREILVVEDKRPRLEEIVRAALYGMTDAPIITGKKRPDGTSLLPLYGAVDADVLATPLRERLLQRVDSSRLAPIVEHTPRRSLPLLPRTPYFCSGCPHNSGLRVPEGTRVAAGIGCHSMVAFMSPDVVGSITGVTQMGGEGAQWIGAAPFVSDEHIVQNLGEGTFFHSGEMAVRASVAAGVNITYKILYNRAVAMTGGQHAVGALDVPGLARLLLDVGVKKVIITAEDRRRYRHIRLPRGVELLDRDDIVEAQLRLKAYRGVTVLIHDQQCAAEARRLRKQGKQPTPPRQVVINERVCEGCGDCGHKSNCLSVRPVDTEFGPKTQIDQSSCNRDYSCLKGDCPSFVTIKPANPRWWSRRPRGEKAERTDGMAPLSADLAADAIPAPRARSSAASVALRMPGIGGTGVVTAAQIIGTAALLSGKYVTGLDQTGLAQKGGPVVSDLSITDQPPLTSAKIASGGIDVLLAFDLVVALNPGNLAGADPERTVVVGTTDQTPTGQMIGTGSRQPSVEDMTAALDECTRKYDNVYLDMSSASSDLFGTTTCANLLGVGVAYQLGLLPLGADAIERAIELNGVSVKTNQLAFRWGRMFVADRARFDEVRASSSVVPASRADALGTTGRLEVLGKLKIPGAIGDLVVSRAIDLVEYQNVKYARGYVRDVERVRVLEEAVRPGSIVLTEAVARYLYKLLAYKDEYEVARLHLADAAQTEIDAVAAGRPVRVFWHLHPPLLRAIGMKRKLVLGPWFKPVFMALRSMRGLRGTRADIFGYAHVRRVERALIREYREWLRSLESALTPENLDSAVRVATAPDMVRGYEEIKLGNVARYEELRRELLPQLKTT